MNWQCIDTGFRSGSENMAIDIQLANDLKKNNSKQTLRFYKWNPFCISLGYNQSDEIINYEFCKKENIDVVKRPTGGRAILHANELTYSVVMFLNGKTNREIYCEISKALIYGLNKIGVKSEISGNEMNLNSFYKNDNSAFACFGTSTKYEIQINGKKIIGSAQRIINDNIILQHGSILFDNTHLKLVDFLNLESNEKILINKKLENKITSLSEYVDYKKVEEQFKISIFEGFKLLNFSFDATCITENY